MTSSTAMTTRTSDAVTSGVDLNKPETFRGQTLTPDQLKERLRVLTELEENLDAQGQKLSPKSAKELDQVVDLTKRANTEFLDGLPAFPICRLRAPHYYVQFGRSKIELYKEVSRQIVEVPRTPVQVLQALQPMAQASWFQGAIIAQAESVLSSEFMNAIKATLVGNMCMLRASVLLMGKPDLFREILALYSSSNDLYNTQIRYNRQCEVTIIGNTESSYRALKSLHQQILEISGPTLEDKPALAEAVQAFIKEEAQLSMKANEVIAAHCDAFLAQIEVLKKSTEACMATITAKNKKVVAAMDHMGVVVQQQTALTEKQTSLQTEFETFQNAKQKESNSRKTFTKTENTKLLWWTYYTTSRTEIVQEDFGSKDAYDRYLAVRKEEGRVAASLEQAKQTLANSMGEVLGYGQDKETLQGAVNALSTSVMCVQQLEVALKQRRTQAQNQIDTCKQMLAASPKADGSLHKVENVLAFIQEGMSAVVKKQALWLASNRQTFTLQNFQMLEQGVRTEVIAALTGSGANPASIAAKATKLLEERFPSNVNDLGAIDRVVRTELIPYQRMLALTEGTDYDQKFER